MTTRSSPEEGAGAGSGVGRGVAHAAEVEVPLAAGKGNEVPKRRGTLGSGRQIHRDIQQLAASLTADSRGFSLGQGLSLGKLSMAQSRLDRRSARERDLLLTLGPEGAEAPREALDEKAVAVIRRVQDKLTGGDFGNTDPYQVPEQVDRLIKQATSNENLCQCFIGWCPFW